MSPSRPPIEQGRLFDFDLDEGEPEGAGPAAEKPLLPLDEDPDERTGEPEEEPSALDVPLERPKTGQAPAAATASAPPAEGTGTVAPSAGSRFLAGGLDVLLHLLLAGTILGLLKTLGVPLAPRSLAAVTLVLLVFSFFYVVISLAFWGATLGMSALDLMTDTEGDEPVAFGQAARRWLGGVLTVGAAGLPALLVFTGRSLADRLSGSRVSQA